MYIMIARAEFEAQLIRQFNISVMRKQFVDSINHLMLTNYKVSPQETNELFFGKRRLHNASIEELYWLGQSIQVILNSTKLNLEKYFTKHEVIAFLKSRRKSVGLDYIYPIVFGTVMQVTSDQCVCVSDVKFLYSLYKKQLIKYNKNTHSSSAVIEKDGITECKINNTFILNSVALFAILDYNFKVKSRNETIDLAKYLKDTMNIMIEDDMFEYDFKTMAVIFREARLYRDDENYIDKIETMAMKKNHLNDKAFRRREFTIAIAMETDKIGRSSENV